MGILLAGVFKIKGISSEGGLMLGECLISLPARVLHAVIGMLPHVFPIRGRVL